jgi:hypothetical protein
MAEPLLNRILAEIRARLRECEAAVREFERLEAALVVLGGDQAVPARASSPSDPRSASRGRGGSGRRSSGRRAPRGANRAAVLKVLADRPGVSATELSSASGVAKPVLYNLLKTLKQRGEIREETLPAGTTRVSRRCGAAGRSYRGIGVQALRRRTSRPAPDLDMAPEHCRLRSVVMRSGG